MDSDKTNEVEIQKYQLLPALTPDEYDALRDSINVKGVLIPIEFDEEGNILDGYHRVQACNELGIKNYPKVTKHGMSEEQKHEYVLTVNLTRRQVSDDFKKQQAQDLRKKGWSFRNIAKVLGIGHGTAERWCKEEGVQDGTPEKVQGMDGKEYPSTQSQSYSSGMQQEEPPKNDVPQTQGANVLPSSEKVVPVVENEENVTVVEKEPAWYVPSWLIEKVHKVMSGIDLDPASDKEGNRIVKAQQYYTERKSGLSQEWRGCVWLNPPWDLIAEFVQKLLHHFNRKDVTEAIILTCNDTESEWFQELLLQATAIILLKGKINHQLAGGELVVPSKGECLFYFGDNPQKFLKEFGELGWGVNMWTQRSQMKGGGLK